VSFILHSHQILCEIAQMDLHSEVNSNNAGINVLLFCTLTNPTAGEALGAPCRKTAGKTQACEIVYPWFRLQWLHISKVFS